MEERNGISNSRFFFELPPNGLSTVSTGESSLPALLRSLCEYSNTWRVSSKGKPLSYSIRERIYDPPCRRLLPSRRFPSPISLPVDFTYIFTLCVSCSLFRFVCAKIYAISRVRHEKTRINANAGKSVLLIAM